MGNLGDVAHKCFLQGLRVDLGENGKYPHNYLAKLFFCPFVLTWSM